MSKKVILTGIKPTGEIHIGNYLGSIKPALARVNEYEARYFIADYHALNTIKNPEILKLNNYHVAASWLACGLDPEKVLFYRQSDVPETFELSTFLMAFTAKGLMNRAHAYKASVQANQEKKNDPDKGVNMGLFTYPILMAADIILFDTDVVPVGRDQKQHVEMAADIVQAINHNYGSEILRVPQPEIAEAAVVPGLDGRKMSKSYDNVIPMFSTSKKLRKIVMKIVTNSQEVEESKSIEGCNIFAFYELFATQEQQAALKQRYEAGGMGWGHAKQELFEVLEAHLIPYREKFDSIINDTAYLDKILAEGAEKAREIASKTILRIRKTAGF